MNRLVLDTDVVVAALRSPSGASAEILRLLVAGKITILLTVALALEYEAVCCDPEHVLASGLSRRQVDVFVDSLLGLAEPVQVHYLWRPVLRDPGDELVLEAAVNGRAEALVTFNRRDFAPFLPEFGIEVLAPREALARIRKRYRL